MLTPKPKSTLPWPKLCVRSLFGDRSWQRDSQRVLSRACGSFHSADGLEGSQPVRGGFAAECLCISRHGGDPGCRLVCRQGEQAALECVHFVRCRRCDVPADLFELALGAWSFHNFFRRGGNDFPTGLGRGRQIFRQKHYAKIRGYMVLFYTWGGVFGPVAAGAVFDKWQTYEPLLWSLIGVFLVAGGFFASLSRSWQRATGRVLTAH